MESKPKLYWLISQTSRPNLKNRCVSCGKILRFICTYDSQLWGKPGKSNNEIP